MEIEVVELRAWESVIVTVRFLAPAVVLEETVVKIENTLSDATMSPFEPSSKNGNDEEPPIGARLPLTEMPVLVGLLPGETLTVRRVVAPTPRVGGVAEPLPDGLVEADPP